MPWMKDANGQPVWQDDAPAQQGGNALPPNPIAAQQRALDNTYKGNADTRSQIGTNIAQEGAARDARNEGFDNAKDLRDEFNKLPDVQDYRAAIKAYSTALKTSETPAGDLNLIYAFAKIMDPTSVVREGEQAAVAGGDTIRGQIEAKLKRELADGGGTFRANYRNQLRSELQTRVAELNTSYESQRAQYQNFAKELNVDPNVVIGQHDGARFHNDIKKYWEEQGVPVVSEGRDEQGNPLPQGARVPEGGSAGPAGGDYRDSLLGQGMSGLYEGVSEFAGAPADLLAMGMNLVPQGINAAANTNLATITNPVAGSQWFKDRLSGYGIYDESKEPTKQFARRAMQSIGSTAIPVGAAPRSLATAAKAFGIAGGGGVGAAAAEQAFPGNPVAEFTGEVLGSGLTAGGIIGSGRRAAMRQAMEEVPTVPNLKEQASNLYNQAESRGITAGPDQTQQLSTNLRDFLTSKGRITPDGQITEVYPKVKEAMRLTDGYSGQTMTPTQMQPVRSVIADGLTSQDGSERYLARKMTGIFDEWANPQAPELAQARDISSRYLNAEKLEQARELARARESQLTQSGPENALRTQYRALDRNSIMGNGPQNEDLRAAIEKVNRGTPLSNAARTVGKLAPTSPMAITLGMVSPTALGTMVGGPGVGAAIGGGSAALGLLGRGVSTRMTDDAAYMAELIARNGGALDVPPLLDAETQRAIQMATMGQSANYLTEDEKKRRQPY